MMSARGQKDGTFSFLPMDLSGKLIIKARLGEDVRRVPIHNEDITYDELLLMLQRVYRGKLTNTDDVTLKYCDEEGDMVTITDSSDLNLAKQLSRLLKINIFIHGREPLPVLDASEVQEFRKELVLIRDKVNVLINALGGDKTGLASGSTVDRDGRQQQSVSVSQQQQRTQPTVSETPSKPESEQSRPKPVATDVGIFDPLKDLKPQSAQQPSSSTVASSQPQPNSAAHLFSQQADTSSSAQFLTSSTAPPPQQPQQHTSQTGYPPSAVASYSSPSPSSSQQPVQASGDPYYSQQQQQPQQQYTPQQPGYGQAYPGAPPSAPTPTPPPATQQPYPATQQQQQPQPSTGYPAGPYGGGSAQPYGFQPQTSQASYASFPKQGPQYTQQAYSVYNTQRY